MLLCHAGKCADDLQNAPILLDDKSTSCYGPHATFPSNLNWSFGPVSWQCQRENYQTRDPNTNFLLAEPQRPSSSPSSVFRLNCRFKKRAWWSQYVSLLTFPSTVVSFPDSQQSHQYFHRDNNWSRLVVSSFFGLLASLPCPLTPNLSRQTSPPDSGSVKSQLPGWRCRKNEKRKAEFLYWPLGAGSLILIRPNTDIFPVWFKNQSSFSGSDGSLPPSAGSRLNLHLLFLFLQNGFII